MIRFENRFTLGREFEQATTTRRIHIHGSSGVADRADQGKTSQRLTIAIRLLFGVSRLPLCEHLVYECSLGAD